MNITLESLQSEIARNVANALAEDIGKGDITAALINPATEAQAHILTREDCVLCGQAWAEEAFRQVGGLDDISWSFHDGDLVPANTVFAKLRGKASKLLSAERTALNFLQLLSGVATLAQQYAQAAAGSSIKILDTRKTLPGLRLAQKYAVAVGGCHNHRLGLYDAFLIKENHIAACGGISAAIATARQMHPGKIVEVEVENLDELKEALAAKANIVMLDNFDEPTLAQAMALDKGKSQYELSGNLSLEDIDRLKRFNIDFISFGGLTKHVRAVDLSFRLYMN